MRSQLIYIFSINCNYIPVNIIHCSQNDTTTKCLFLCNGRSASHQLCCAPLSIGVQPFVPIAPRHFLHTLSELNRHSSAL